MFNQVHLTALAGMKSFSFGDFFMTNQDSGCPLGEEAMRKRLRGLVKAERSFASVGMRIVSPEIR